MRKSETKSSDTPKSGERSGRSSDPPPPVRAEEREHMIAEAAYYLAEHRGFNGGDPVEDWLAAEADIDARLAAGMRATPEEAAAYARVREEVRKAFAELHDNIDATAVKRAYERGLAEVRRLERYSAQAVQRAGAVLREELSRTADRLGPAWERFAASSAGVFEVWRGRAPAFIGRAAEAVRHWLQRERRGPEH